MLAAYGVAPNEEFPLPECLIYLHKPAFHEFKFEYSTPGAVLNFKYTQIPLNASWRH